MRVERLTCEAMKGRVGPALNADPFTSAPTGKVPLFIIPALTVHRA